MYSLKSITKRNNAFLYHLEVIKPDGIEYVEMRRNRLNSKSIYLCARCMVSITDNYAELSLSAPSATRLQTRD